MRNVCPNKPLMFYIFVVYWVGQKSVKKCGVIFHSRFLIEIFVKRGGQWSVILKYALWYTWRNCHANNFMRIFHVGWWPFELFQAWREFFIFHIEIFLVIGVRCTQVHKLKRLKYDKRNSTHSCNIETRVSTFLSTLKIVIFKVSWSEQFWK